MTLPKALPTALIPKPSISVVGSLVGGRSSTPLAIAGSLMSYAHRYSVDMGFDTCTFSLAGNRAQLESWMNRLADVVEAYDIDLDVAFRGFVNKVTYSVGAFTTTIGPLLQVANRLVLIYAPIIDATVNPVIVGATRETQAVDDTLSQEKYGIMEMVFSAGERLESDLSQIETALLERYAAPDVNNELSIGDGGSDASVSIELLGMGHLFQRYIYNSASTGTTTIATQIASILNAEPNGYFSSTNATIAANGTLVPQLQRENRYASDVLRDLMAKGDVNADRYIFEVIENDHFVYRKVTNEIKYQFQVFGETQRLFNNQAQPARIGSIRAGFWVYASDVFVAQNPNLINFNKDPRMLFVESFEYSYPNSIAINGSKVYKTPQVLARLGLGGI